MSTTKHTVELGHGGHRDFPMGVAVMVYALLALVAVSWSWLRGDSPLLLLEVHDWWYALSLGGGCGALAALLAFWCGRRWRWASRMETTLSKLLGRLNAGQALLLALLSAGAEEALFRGALQPSLGLVPAALLFGLAHWAPLSVLRPWVPLATLMGLVLGWLMDHSGSLLAPLACHLVVNAVGLWRLAVRVPAGPQEDGAVPGSDYSPPP